MQRDSSGHPVLATNTKYVQAMPTLIFKGMKITPGYMNGLTDDTEARLH